MNAIDRRCSPAEGELASREREREREQERQREREREIERERGRKGEREEETEKVGAISETGRDGGDARAEGSWSGLPRSTEKLQKALPHS